MEIDLDGFEVRASLPYAVESVAGARRLVEQLRDRCPETVVSNAKLLVSELATNAVKYGRPDKDLEVRIVPTDGDLLHFSVSSASGQTTPQRRPYWAGGGLGLGLVDQLAQRWGTDQQDGRTTVWFTLACSEPSQPSGARSSGAALQRQ